MLTSLMNNPIAWLILALVTVASLIFAIFSHITNKERKEITYAKITNTLIYNQKKSFEKLKVFYEEKPIDNLYVSRIAIWNSGNRVLKETDFVKDNSLRINLENESEILEATIIKETENTNKFTISQNNAKQLDINFDYVDKKDGVILQVIYTGKKRDLKISCKIMGGEPIKEFTNESFYEKGIVTIIRNKKIRIRYFVSNIVLLFIAGIMMMVFGIKDYYFPKKINNTFEALQKNKNDSFIGIIGGLFIILLTIFLLCFIFKRNYYGIPSKIRKSLFDEGE